MERIATYCPTLYAKSGSGQFGRPIESWRMYSSDMAKFEDRKPVVEKTIEAFARKQQSIARAKGNFLNGAGLVLSAFVRTDVRVIWQDCLSRGLDPHSKSLPASINDDSVLPDHAVSALLLMRDRTTKSFQSEADELRRRGIAVFPFHNLDKMPIAFDAIGDESIISSLEGCGMTIGSCLRKEAMGLNAATLSFSSGSPLWLIGEENYFDCLCGYAFYIDPGYGGDLSFFHGEFALMYVVKAENYLEQEVFIERSAFARTKTSSLRNVSQLFVKYRAFDNLLSRKEVALMIADQEGIITDASQFCETVLGLRYINLLGRSVNEAFPEIGFNDVLESDERGCFFRCSPISSAEKKLSFEIERISDTSGKLGYSIYVSNSTQPRDDAIRRKPKASFSFSKLTGGNPRFVHLVCEAQQAAAIDCNILISGESGTGKETMAHCIHNASLRKDGPFLSMDCGGYLTDTIDGVLFGDGYAPPPTSGHARFAGKIGQANGGTLYLANIDALPLHTQSILVSILRGRTMARGGGAPDIHVDVRVIASSKIDLDEAVSAEYFLLDLLILIGVIKFKTIPLRDRRDDIPELAKSMVSQLGLKMGRNTAGITPEAMDYLCAYRWPGNLRELRSVLERAVGFETAEKLTCKHLPDEVKILISDRPLSIRSREESETESDTRRIATYQESEAQRIKRLMREFNGNKTRVAEALGISRNTLYRRLKEITHWR